MKVALLTYRGNMFCGGQGIYASYLAKALNAQGVDVDVISGPPFPEVPTNVPLRKIPNNNVFGTRLSKWARERNPLNLLTPLSAWEALVSRVGVFPEMQTFSLRVLREWPRLQREKKYDIAIDNQCLGWGLLGLQVFKTPVVGLIHHPLHIDRAADFAIDSKWSQRIRRTLYFPLFMQEIVAPRLQQVVTVSQASRKEISKYFKIPERNIEVILNGTDTDTFRPDPTIEKGFDLIFVGRTEDRKKGISTLIEALRYLPHVKLNIVDGRIPEDGLALRAIRRFGVGNQVTLRRNMLSKDELVREYCSAKLAVVPSLYEGFGFPASEAMSCGLPVVANSAGALPEVLGTDETCGALAQPNDPKALSEKISLFLNDPQRLGIAGQNARKRVLRMFQWDVAANRWITTLEDTLRVTHG